MVSDESLKAASILIVDDQDLNIALLTELLTRHGYSDLRSTTDARQVTALYGERQPDLILLDLVMPQLSGFEVMEQLRPLTTPDDYLPILVLTADTTFETKQRALSGGAKDFLAKPFIFGEVALRVGNLLETRLLQRRLREQNALLETLAGGAATAADKAQLFEELQRANAGLVVAYDATIERWAHAIDLRDRETEGHSRRVAALTEQLARMVGMGEEEIAHIRRGALLHDIGKVGVPDNISLKPSRLREEEWARMRQHPQLAYDLLSPIDYLRPALGIPYCHHERWDGTGYPRGLRGKEIPLEARLFAVVDAWDALRSDRPYRARWPEEKALEHIRSGAGTHFYAEAVDLFLRMVSETAARESGERVLG